jgi:hypothetical protein
LRRWACERLEERTLLSSVPLGATNRDLSEFMIGTVLVTTVLMESNGTLDPDTQNWTQWEIDWQKHRFFEAAKWWETVFNNQGSLHSLKFEFDFTYLEKPFSTKYEPISRVSHENILWVREFLEANGYQSDIGTHNLILQFNHDQRVKHNANWSFTTFVVDASSAPGFQFPPGGLRNAFAYPGGHYIVTHSMRPEATIAHEIAHMFWAMDEYEGGSSYTAHRGYYDTQNTNAVTGNPDRSKRELSIMEDMNIAWVEYAVSQSARETIGWRDSDGDRIFDVLDVPLELTGSGSQDPVTKAFSFAGTTKVGTLRNQNSMGWRHDMTINRVGRIEYRFDNEPEWKTAVAVGEYTADINLQVDVPAGATWIELRAAEQTLPLYSEVIRQAVVSETASPWWNRREPLDVNDDQQITPLDALLVVNYLNLNGAGVPVAGETAPPYIDCNGDRVIAPIDALIVINRLNQDAAVGQASAVLAMSSSPVDALAGVFGEGENDQSILAEAAVALASRSHKAPLGSAEDAREPSLLPTRTAAGPTVGSVVNAPESWLTPTPLIAASNADRHWCEAWEWLRTSDEAAEDSAEDAEVGFDWATLVQTVQQSGRLSG